MATRHIPLTALLALFALPLSAQESPWLITPTVSSDPKLGTNGGLVGGYLLQLDENSRQSLVIGSGSYSNTDSWTAGLFADLHFGGNQHRLRAGGFRGGIKNEYDDYLGSGFTVKTEDDMNAYFVRYGYRVRGDWYVGAQAIRSNYTIGIDEIIETQGDQIGLTGVDAAGIGAVVERDSRDSLRNPTEGSRFVLSNVAYRESVGGDQDFDAISLDYRFFQPVWGDHTLAVQVLGRWSDDAPLAGYSSVRLRGYTRGNYLAENYTHIDADLRLRINDRWSAAVFAGIGCLYDNNASCGDSESRFPAVGAGAIYLLKPEAGIVVRAEFAKGKADNSAFYLSLNHPF